MCKKRSNILGLNIDFTCVYYVTFLVFFQSLFKKKILAKFAPIQFPMFLVFFFGHFSKRRRIAFFFAGASFARIKSWFGVI